MRSVFLAAGVLCLSLVVCAESVFAMSPAFHRTLLNAGGYTAEFDLAADTHYDASGLGRLQHRGAPPMLCLSVPFARKPSYVSRRAAKSAST